MFKIVEIQLEDGEIAKGLVDLESPKQSPIVVDFRSPKLTHRLKNGADGEAIVKAFGVKRSERRGLRIYDFTAGLGTEAFLLARAGFTVLAFERHPLIFELLEDGLRRWRAYEQTTGLETDGGTTAPTPLKLEFRFGDAAALVREGLARGSMPQAHAVFLDPMFEGDATEGKSLPKKEMATLRKMLHASPEDASSRSDSALFFAAFEIAEARVVVKRPNGAPDLLKVDALGRPIQPARRLEGKTARFDIYSCR